MHNSAVCRTVSSPCLPYRPYTQEDDDCCNGLQKLSSANNDGLHLIESGKLMWFVTMVLLIRNEKFRGFLLEDNGGGKEKCRGKNRMRERDEVDSGMLVPSNSPVDIFLSAGEHIINRYLLYNCEKTAPCPPDTSSLSLSLTCVL